MSYSSNDLSALTYANGFTLWHYKTKDDSDVVDNAGYFNTASKMLRVGDFIFINTGIDTVPQHGVMVVISNTDGTVNVSNMVSFGILNTD